MNKIIIGDCRTIMRDLIAQGVKVQMCVTSPPYWGLRSYGIGTENGEIGLEKTPEDYVAAMVEVFRLVRELLADDGVLFLNLGDTYYQGNKGNSGELSPNDKQATNKGSLSTRRGEMLGSNRNKIITGLKPKDLCMIPARVALALQADGWWLRQDIIWAKPNPMPESVTDRCTKSHEYLFLMAKAAKYYYDAEAIKEPATYAPSSGDHRPPGIVRDRLYGYDSKEAALRGRVITETKNSITIRHPTSKHGNAQQSPKSLLENRNKRSVWTITTQPFSARALHGVSGGSGRIVSPDCPIHAVQRYLESKAVSDAQRAASQSAYNLRTDGHPELWLEAERVPIDLRHAEHSSPDNSDSLAQPCVEIAIDRSIESHKMAPVLSTLRHEILGGESPDRIGDNIPSSVSSANVGHIPESNTVRDYGAGARVSDRAAQSPDHSVCTCTYETIIDHFAVFPQALVEPCVLAGSRPGDIVFDPFIGSGTTAQVAEKLGRKWLGCDLNPAYKTLQEKRTAQIGMIYG